MNKQTIVITPVVEVALDYLRHSNNPRQNHHRDHRCSRLEEKFARMCRIPVQRAEAEMMRLIASYRQLVALQFAVAAEWSPRGTEVAK